MPVDRSHRDGSLRYFQRVALSPCADRVCEFIYLPPYSSPDLNPIKETLSKVTRILRNIGTRTKETLIEALGEALGAVSTEDVRGFLHSLCVSCTDAVPMKAAVNYTFAVFLWQKAGLSTLRLSDLLTDYSVFQ
jgi:hypothetical protein